MKNATSKSHFPQHQNFVPISEKQIEIRKFKIGKERESEVTKPEVIDQRATGQDDGERASLSGELGGEIGGVLGQIRRQIVLRVENLDVLLLLSRHARRQRQGRNRRRSATELLLRLRREKHSRSERSEGERLSSGQRKYQWRRERRRISVKRKREL